VGDTFFVEAGHPALYASLRVSREETILILINLGGKAVSDYSLTLEEGPLSGEYILAPLLDAAQFTTPAITQQGGFENYQPVPEIPPYGRFILQLQPQTK
jgi:hypothetical protein